MATRLAKAAEFDAIVVAAVAFERLGLARHLSQLLDVDTFVPQVAQAALAVECRADDALTRELVGAIEHAPSRRRVDAERAFLAELGGDCSLPAGAHAQLRPDGSLHLRAVLADAVGGEVLVDEDELDAARVSDPGALEQLGRGVARRLRDALAAS
jgi:hydroxymethylbilane synthase